MSLGHTLVIRPGALGDAVLTLPALHALRLAGARSLTVLGTPGSWVFVRKAHESIRVRDFASADWLGLFAPDVPLGPSAQAALAQTQTAIVYLADGSGVVDALRRHGVRTVLCGNPPRAEGVAPSLHASRCLLEPLRGLVDDRALARGPEFLAQTGDPLLELDENERILALGKLGLDTLPDDGIVALHPGSGGRRKCWPAERFAKLAVELACRRSLLPLVFFGPADDDAREEFECALPPGVAWECVAGRSLREVFALLALCRAYAGNDSGLTHLAARACPVVALFGPTSPEVWRPLGENVRVLRGAGGDLRRIEVDAVCSAFDAL